MSVFGSLARGIVNLAGKAVETVGNALGSEKISSWGRSIQDRCAERVSTENSYDRTEANIHTTDRMNEILVSFSEGYMEKAVMLEKRCVELVELYYDRLIEIMENAPQNAHNAANLRILKSAKGRIAKTISGGIKEPLSKRMSLDDSECLKILKMAAGSEKKKAMTSFTDKVIKESLDNLAKSVRTSLNEQSQDIEDYLTGISEEQENAMQALKEQFDKMVADSELEKSDKEKNCILPLYRIDAVEHVLKIVE